MSGLYVGSNVELKVSARSLSVLKSESKRRPLVRCIPQHNLSQGRESRYFPISSREGHMAQSNFRLI